MKSINERIHSLCKAFEKVAHEYDVSISDVTFKNEALQAELDSKPLIDYGSDPITEDSLSSLMDRNDNNRSWTHRMVGCDCR